jgi:hypothetical protein
VLQAAAAAAAAIVWMYCRLRWLEACVSMTMQVLRLVPAESEKGARIYSLRRVVATNTEYYAYGEAPETCTRTLEVALSN